MSKDDLVSQSVMYCFSGVYLTKLLNHGCLHAWVLIRVHGLCIVTKQFTAFIVSVFGRVHRLMVQYVCHVILCHFCFSQYSEYPEERREYPDCRWYCRTCTGTFTTAGIHVCVTLPVCYFERSSRMKLKVTAFFWRIKCGVIRSLVCVRIILLC